MKSLMLTVLLMLASFQVGAYDDDIRATDNVVDYISWCEENKVVSMDSNGQFVVKADCSQESLVCKTLKRRSVHGTYFYGACLKSQ